MQLFGTVYTHNEISTFATKYGLEDIAIGSSKEGKMTNVARHLISNPELPGVLSNHLSYDIVEDIIKRITLLDWHYDKVTKEFKNYPYLRRYLLKNGYVIEDGNLIKTFETDIDFNTNETYLSKLLNKYQLANAKGHYEQALNAFNRGDWASCNAQLRSYTEEVLNRLAEKVTGKVYGSPDMKDHHQAKIELSKANPPIFYKPLNEWTDDGKGFFETFWRRLHPHGSHPGLSDENDSVFRLNLVQITTLEILRRYDEHYGI